MDAKDVRTLLALDLWTPWKHRNAVVFDGATPPAIVMIRQIEAEGRAWKMAGLIRGNYDGLFDVNSS